MRKSILILLLSLLILTNIAFAAHNAFRDRIDVRYNYGNYYLRPIGFYDRVYPHYTTYFRHYPYSNYPNVHPYGSSYYSFP